MFVRHCLPHTSVLLSAHLLPDVHATCSAQPVYPFFVFSTDIAVLSFCVAFRTYHTAACCCCCCINSWWWVFSATTPTSSLPAVANHCVSAMYVRRWHSCLCSRFICCRYYGRFCRRSCPNFIFFSAVPATMTKERR